jgi:hypothetical protein
VGVSSTCCRELLGAAAKICKKIKKAIQQMWLFSKKLVPNLGR